MREDAVACAHSTEKPVVMTPVPKFREDPSMEFQLISNEEKDMENIIQKVSSKTEEDIHKMDNFSSEWDNLEHVHERFLCEWRRLEIQEHSCDRHNLETQSVIETAQARLQHLTKCYRRIPWDFIMVELANWQTELENLVPTPLQAKLGRPRNLMCGTRRRSWTSTISRSRAVQLHWHISSGWYRSCLNRPNGALDRIVRKWQSYFKQFHNQYSFVLKISRKEISSPSRSSTPFIFKVRLRQKRSSFVLSVVHLRRGMWLVLIGTIELKKLVVVKAHNFQQKTWRTEKDPTSECVTNEENCKTIAQSGTRSWFFLPLLKKDNT